MELTEALRTTGAAREFEDEPVSDDALYELLDIARFAPNGGNRQPWRVVVVRDAAQRRSLRDVYLRGWYEYLAQAQAGLCPWSATNDPEDESLVAGAARELAAAAASGGGGFAEKLDEVPALLVLLADLRRISAVDRDLERLPFVAGASVYPFAWSLLLAARSFGYGGVVTTVATRNEGAVRELLGIPEEFGVAAVIALGRPRTQPRRLRRAPVEEFTTVDRFEGPPLRG